MPIQTEIQKKIKCSNKKKWERAEMRLKWAYVEFKMVCEEVKIASICDKAHTYHRFTNNSMRSLFIESRKIISSNNSIQHSPKKKQENLSKEDMNKKKNI